MKIRLAIFYFIALFAILSGNEDPKKKTICLNMIVKNESKVITRCLESVKPIIDHWVIVDTGSTDGTQQIIKDFMQDVPGELHERPWVNFGHNRNEALQLAKEKADYVLFMDADDVLKIADSFQMPALDKDAYYVLIAYAGTDYYRNLIIKNDLDWNWVGVLHEVIVSSQAKTQGTLEGLTAVVNTDGARSSDPQKYQKDATVLEEALAKEPTNTRYAFYLAQSYKDAQDYPKALEAYKKRIAMGGWPEEVFHSMLQVANLQKALDMPRETIIAGYYQAYHNRPTRAEPLYYLANYYRSKGDYAAGYLIASVGQQIPQPNDVLFVEKWVYEYGLPLELSVCAYWVGKYEECQKMSLKLLALPNLPKSYRECALRNLAFANLKLAEMGIIKTQVLAAEKSHVNK